jgi:hypothetical protein
MRSCRKKCTTCTRARSSNLLQFVAGLCKERLYKTVPRANIGRISMDFYFYARVLSAIAPDCSKRMQKEIDDYIWLSNAPESIRHAEAGRPVQRHVCATAVYAPLPEGVLPVQRLEHVIAANHAWAVRKGISPNHPWKSISRGNELRMLTGHAGLDSMSCSPRSLRSLPAPLYFTTTRYRPGRGWTSCWHRLRAVSSWIPCPCGTTLASSRSGQVMSWDSLVVPYPPE